jgi:hypothetical protein
LSTWRRKAIEAIPEMRDEIEQAWSPMALWIDICLPFKQAVVDGNMEYARRIMSYARYCLDSPSIDVRTAVALGFIEHLAEGKTVRDALPLLMTLEEIRGLRSIMAYHAGESVISDLEQTMVRLRKHGPDMQRRQA